MFGAREDQHLAPSLAGHQMLQQICFTGFIDRVNGLIDAAYRGIGGCDLNFLWLMQELAGQCLDIPGERGRKHQGLPLFGQLRVDAAHRRDKAHVEHPVGLVEHPNPHVVEAQRTLPQQIQEATGSGNQDIGTTREMADLRSDVDAATHHLAVQFESRAVGANAIGNLCRQFTGGRQDQTADILGTRAGTALQHMERRQREGGGFAGARLCCRHQVAT